MLRLLHHRRLATGVVGLAALFLSLVLVSGPARPAGAIDNGEWAVLPTSEGGLTSRTSFVLDLEPGTRLEDSVTIQNLTDEVRRFSLYVADAFNPDGGGIAVAGPENAPTGAASWITLATNELELPARTQGSVPFSVTVPADATPGDHAAGIAALDLDSEEAPRDGDVQVDVQRAVAVPMFVRVSGDVVPSVGVSGIAVDSRSSALPGGDRNTEVTVTITNDGNVRLSPEVSVSVGGLGASDTPTEPLELDDMLPGSSQTVTVDAGDGPFLGPGAVDVTVVADGITVERTESFWTVPWLALALSLTLLLVVWAVLRRRRRPRRRSSPGEPLEPYMLVVVDQ